ncbi:MAG: class I mannose-6-phosphate isomerase, partial [Clostridiales bacterium]|nr:class I mannose-6-phosphate isomerase [Clostridiales bacterium]
MENKVIYENIYSWSSFVKSSKTLKNFLIKMKKLYPYIKDYIWGGQKLIQSFHKAGGTARIAESWEFSVHNDGPSRLDNGILLSEFVKDNPNLLGSNCQNGIEILIKLIDAADNLSVQVHPNDKYAKKYNERGKREMWYIVESVAGAGIYCGLKNDMSKERLEKILQKGTILHELNFYKVKKGDSFFIEAGTVHAIGKGIVLCEVQQSSNLTYRLHDYGRLGADKVPRQLHIKQALDVCNLNKFVCSNNTFFLSKSLKWLCGCKDFSVYELTVEREFVFTTNQKSFACLVI